MIYCFDLDGTLCLSNSDYNMCKPISDRIEFVNKLYEKGHTIIIDTARGSVTGMDWTELTKKQLYTWGLKYHKLQVGIKIFANVYVDNNAINDNDFFK